MRKIINRSFCVPIILIGFIAVYSSFSFALSLSVPHPEFLLPAPPVDASVEAHAERAYIKSFADFSSSDDLRLAQADAKDESVSIFEIAIPGFIISDLPATSELFYIIRSEEKKITYRFKNFFDRRRPYQVDTSIEPCIKPKKHYVSSSNPSGHAVMAFTFAVVLVDLLPKYSIPIMSRAELYAQNRILCGVHHPFDVRSGQVLGTVIGLEVLRSPDFKPYLDAARAELVAKGLQVQ